MWRDTAGKLWEVTPNAVIDKDRPEAGFVGTEFLPDPEAQFEISSDENWVAGHSRYVPLRPAGVAVTELLTQAQYSTGNTRVGLLNKTAADIMSKTPRTTNGNIMAQEALRLMNEWKVACLFVVDDGAPVGIIRLHDILRAGAA